MGVYLYIIIVRLIFEIYVQLYDIFKACLPNFYYTDDDHLGEYLYSPPAML